jgi:hypothetical protein
MLKDSRTKVTLTAEQPNGKKRLLLVFGYDQFGTNALYNGRE